MRRRTSQILWVILLFFVSTSCDHDVPSETGEPHVEAPVEAYALPVPMPSTKTVDRQAPVDPYAGWQRRCEPELALCRSDDDCKDVFHPSGKAMKCIKPYWSKKNAEGQWTKVCSPGWSNREERQWRRDRLRRLVTRAYFDELDTCINGLPLEQQSRACQRETRLGETLTKFLWTVYARETTGRPWKRHRLNGDVSMAKTEWYKQQRRYGYAVAKDKRGQIKSLYACKTLSKRPGEPKWMDACRKRDPSPHFMDQDRWAYGLGPYGQNAALWTGTWDPMAPPEILCGEVEPTEAYLRGARRVWKKLRGGITCNGEFYRPQVTWEILHRGVSGGQLCPARKPSQFRQQAGRHGLDPDQVVTLEMLGSPIDKKQQNETARAVLAFVDMGHPTRSTALPLTWQQ